LNRTDKVHIALSPIFVALVAFCFSMTVGVVWEFFEYTADSILSTDMQKDTIISKMSSVNLTNTNAFDPEIITGIDKTTIHYNNNSITIPNGYLDIGLIDTMEDLIVNFIGALTF